MCPIATRPVLNRFPDCVATVVLAKQFIKKFETKLQSDSVV
jgi:hypothetical protein